MLGVIVFFVGNVIGEYFFLFMFGVWLCLVKGMGENFCCGNIWLVSFFLFELLEFLLLILMFLLYINFLELILLFFELYIVLVFWVFWKVVVGFFLEIMGFVDEVVLLLSLEYIWNWMIKIIYLV